METVSVLVPYPVDKAYDYRVPQGLHLNMGDYVWVPLGKKEVIGVVWGIGQGDVPPDKIKLVYSRIDLPSLPAIHRDFIDWVAGYTLTPKGSVLKMTLSAPSVFMPPKMVSGFKISDSVDPSLYMMLLPSHRRVLDFMKDGKVRRMAELNKLSGCSSSILKKLTQSGFLLSIPIVESGPCIAPDLRHEKPSLSPEQQKVAQCFLNDISSQTFKPSLLDGVTGSGKTETYFEAVAEIIRQGKQALILLPEIALSNAFLDRFQKRFGCAPALWHSNITPAQRRIVWRSVCMGETKVVVGARSALFLPYSQLGVIIIDEEHDPGFKQEEGVIYNARDMAVVRAHLSKIPVILVSATPSLETIYNAWNKPDGTGRYSLYHLHSRYGGARLPRIETIDLRLHKPERGDFLAPVLIEAIKETLTLGEQVLLFLNRRGYAPLTLCRTCGHRFECARCTAWLVEHKKTGCLHCHHCGLQTKIPELCPSCGDINSLVACGPGVERVHEEIKKLFPDIRSIILASDLTQGVEDMRITLQQIAQHKIDLIIGTQIIAKGHHFPKLTLVGVVDADLGLNGGDLRAAERTYQMLHQVAGRAGREDRQGRVYLQSWMPDNRIMKALAQGSRDAFLVAEAQEREAAYMPPYCRLAAIIVAGRDNQHVQMIADELGRSAPQGVNEKGQRIQTLGPAPAPLFRLRGRYRYRLLIRADKSYPIQKVIANWLSGIKIPSNIRVYIDIDPQNFL